MDKINEMRLNHHNPVQPGQTYILPRHDKTFILDEHTGFEVLTLIVTRKRNPDIDNLDNLVSQILNGVDKQEEIGKVIAHITTEKQRGILGISGVKEEPHFFTRHDDGTSLKREYDLWMYNMCDGCYEQIIFEHRD